MTEIQHHLLEVNGVKVYFEMEPGIFQIEDNKYAVVLVGPTFDPNISYTSMVFCDTIEQAREFVKEEDND